MKTCTKCQQRRDMSSFTKNSNSSTGLKSRCKRCDKAYRLGREEEAKEYAKAYYQTNKERLSSANRKWAEDHPSTVSGYKKKWRQNNMDKIKSSREIYQQRTLAQHAHYEAARRARKLQATPNWLTPNDWKWTKWYYTHARTMSILTGISYHVDHIIPLRGTHVCGLHCPTNLQVIPGHENMTKSNTFREGEIF